MRKSTLLALTLLLCAPLSACRAERQNLPPVAPMPAPPPQFSDAERAAIVAYWTAPGRYQVAAPADVSKSGVWQVRLTPEGSIWLRGYQRAFAGAAKIPPTRDAKPDSASPYAAWETWVSAKVAYDKWQAQQTADAANAAIGISVKKGRYTAAPAPPPGPIPPDLLAACGDPPALASAVTPLSYTITFDDGDQYVYTDNVRMRDRFVYYRFAKGVSTGGTATRDLSDTERADLFKSAGLAPGEQHIFEAISKQEGGFDSVQTYDTGYVSVGFIQFVTMADGRTDLSKALLQEKMDQPDEFEKDFRRYGIDVRPLDFTMVVVDPVTGAELSGPDAVMKVIDDKRLLAIFQRAGRRRPFRVAQIKVAKSFYWPVDDPITVHLPDGTTLTGKVGDVIHSEAGLAVLLDRKINTGNWRPLEDVLARVMAAHQCPCRSVTEACPYEREVVAAMKYRFDALADPTLGQPPMLPATTAPGSLLSAQPVADKSAPAAPR